jgi:predicted phosphoadenosine phosphosulfate sulfurtransferase
MEFEDFVHEFGKWYSQGEKTACFIGIRADESYNRYLKVKVKKNREFLDGKMWALRQKSTGLPIYSVHPIYDWRTRDIWIYLGRFKKPYTGIYDLMQKAGLSIHQQRICQPYGDDQRKGLWLFHIIEPETWGRVVARVSGVNSGAEFVRVNGNISGQIKISKPDGHTWQSFSRVLLASMPEHMKEHYTNKIFRFIEWYEERGWTDKEGIRHVGSGCVPDEADNDLEVHKKAPSWRRVTKMLLRNDYWAKTIGFVQNKDGFFYKRYMDRLKKERDCRRKENWKKAGYWKGFV